MTQGHGSGSLLTRDFKVSKEMSSLTGIAIFLPVIAATLTFTGSATYWPSWGLPALWALAVGIIALTVVVGLVQHRIEQARYTQVGGPVLSWQAAEKMAASHMRAYGFSDARTTPSGADGGLDVVSRYGVAQVKYFSKPVGRPDVQRLRGASHGQQRVLFYALTGYTPAAVQFADEADVALFQFDQYGMVWPVNDWAKAYKKPKEVDA
jgi:hypothetical protein